MSYYKMMRGIEEKIAAAKPTKNPDLAGSGLLVRTKAPTGPLRSTSKDISDELASYIIAIRKQKEEIISGKSK